MILTAVRRKSYNSVSVSSCDTSSCDVSSNSRSSNGSSSSSKLLKFFTVIDAEVLSR